MRKTKKFDDYLIESLGDPKEASAYLNIALEEYEKDNDAEAFLIALKDVAEARGGLANLARKTELNRQNLYRVLSGKGNPRLATLGTILNGLDFHLSIEPNTRG